MKAKKALISTLNSFWQFLPVLLAVVFLIGMALVLIPSGFYQKVFTGSRIADPFLGAVLGGIMAGNPATSYIIAGELQKSGVGLIAVVAFLVSWVTVGVVQFPAESLMLGKRFALARNLTSFFFSIIVALFVYLTLNFL
jgi:uncharacterized membrane protein YraQ (UPF0718 family)